VVDIYRRWILEVMDILYTGDGYWKGWTYCIQEMDTGRDVDVYSRRNWMGQAQNNVGVRLL
jgi:hypothetical protein